MTKTDIAKNYDSIAAEYAGAFCDELDKKPFDRDLLDRFASLVPATGRVCDLGCGPGQIAAYLAGRGLEVFGVDLSPGMVDQARRLFPRVAFHQGNMLALDLPERSLAAITAFYCIIHIARRDVVRALREMRRVLAPEGLLLLSCHGGSGEVHLDSWFDKQVSVDTHFFEAQEMEGYLSDAGFARVETMRRPPYPGEYPSERLYFLAHR